MRYIRITSIVALGTSVALTGCTLGPDFTPPETQLPPGYAFAQTGSGAGEVANSGVRDGSLAQWWQGYEDPRLDALIALARESSPDLSMAKARIDKARAQMAEADAQGLPQVGVAAGASVTRLSENSGLASLASAFGGGSSGSGTGSSQGVGAPGSTFENYNAGFDASWEPDLFGKARRSREAASANYRASVFDENAARAALYAEIARAYFAWRSLSAQASWQDDEVSVRQRVYALMDKRVESGLQSGDTLNPYAIALEQSRAHLAGLEEQRDSMAASIATLSGVPLQQILPVLARKGPDGWDVPVPSPGTPADLVRRRPDVQAAEARLAAATAQIGVADASRFPDLTLSGVAEFLSTSLANLISPNSIQLAASGHLGFPVLDFGAGKARVDAAEADAQLSYYQYQKSVIGALGDVEKALVALKAASSQETRLAVVVDRAEAALASAVSAQKAGLTNGMPPLQAEETLATARAGLVQAQANKASASAALYKALGGGWQTSSDRADGSSASVQSAITP